MALIFSGVGGLIPACLISGAPVLAKTDKDATIAVGLMMQGSSLGQVIGPWSSLLLSHPFPDPQRLILSSLRQA
jgi:hypothetical protein